MSLAADDWSRMARALRLAALGLNTTTPNPRVGCVLVRDGEVVGEGWHQRAGEPHAEVHALAAAGARARGGTAYVTLEPCSHHGRTPPCADALLAAGVARVVAAMEDPNPRVAGSGLARLRAAGVEVDCGVLEPEARALNAGFVSRMTRGRPLLRVKLGASLDGRTALADGRSQWITGPAARLDVQHWRARSCAVLTGVGTVLADDARLTVREFEVERQPLRVVLDSALRTPLDSALLRDAVTAPLLLVHGPVDGIRRQCLEQAGAQLWQAPMLDGRIDLGATLQELGRRGLNEVLVEAGATLAGAFMRQDLVDEVLLYQAPLALGSDARGLFDGLRPDSLQQVPRWALVDRRALGADWRLHYIRQNG